MDKGDQAVAASKPILLHNLLESQLRTGGAYAEVSRHLAKAFELRSILAPGGGEFPGSTRLLWWVMPVAGSPTKEGALAQDAMAQRIPGFVEAGGSVLMMIGGSGKDLGMEPARVILLNLGISLGPKRTGAKRLRLPERHAFIGGLVWTTAGLTPMDMEDSLLLRSPVIVSNDLGQKPEELGASDFAGMGMILGEWGRGRVVIVGDTGWVKKPAWGAGADSEGRSDNQRILDGLVRWAIGEVPKQR